MKSRTLHRFGAGSTGNGEYETFIFSKLVFFFFLLYLPLFLLSSRFVPPVPREGTTELIPLYACRIAADEGRFKNNNEVIINTETRSVEVNKKGVYFAFRDEGACISLLAIKVS